MRAREKELLEQESKNCEQELLEQESKSCESKCQSCESKRARVVRFVSARVVRAREQELHSTVQKIQ